MPRTSVGTGEKMYRTKSRKSKWKLSRASEIVIYSWVVGSVLFGGALGTMALMS